MKHPIKAGNYVVATSDINVIRERSVGLVGDVSGEKITVFFIGAGRTLETDNNHVAYLDIEKTGKPYKKKICNICHLLKDIEEFDINQTDAKGRKTTRPTCKECRVAIDGKPLKLEEKKRLEAIKPKGIFTCPICQKTSIVGITAKEQIREIYFRIKEAILNISNELDIKYTKYYIAFVLNNTNIADIHIQNKALKIWINLKKGQLDDPRNMLRDVSQIGHWGNGDYEMSLKHEEHIEYIVTLIKKAYNYHR